MSRSSRPTRRNAAPRRAGKVEPSGWQGLDAPPVSLLNPRPPSVTSTLDLTLEDYYACATLMGLLAAQKREPDRKWCCEWALEMGAKMAAASRKRRRKR